MPMTKRTDIENSEVPINIFSEHISIKHSPSQTIDLNKSHLMPTAFVHDNLIPAQNFADISSISGNYTAAMCPYPTGNFTDYYSDSSTNHPGSTNMSTPSFSELPRVSSLDFSQQERQQAQQTSLQMQQISQEPSHIHQLVEHLQQPLQQPHPFQTQQYLLQQQLDVFPHSTLSNTQLGNQFSHAKVDYVPQFSNPHLALKSQVFPSSSLQDDYRENQPSLGAENEGSSKALHLRSSSISTRALDNSEYIKVKKPKVETTFWEDEKTICYQVEARGVLVSRREDDNYVNGTKLLNATQMTRGKRDGILKTEKNRNGKVVKVGSMNLKGIWIPFERALEIARNEGIEKMLYPLFVKDMSSFYRHKGKYLERNDSDGSEEDELDTDNPYRDDSLTTAPSSGDSIKHSSPHQDPNFISPSGELKSDHEHHSNGQHALPDNDPNYYDQSMDLFRSDYLLKPGDDEFGSFPGLSGSVANLSSHGKKERA